MLGISRDSIDSHKRFIAKHRLTDVTLLSDTDRKVIKLYRTEHWLLPLSNRVYIIVDKNRKIIFYRNTGLSLLKNQTETLLKVIDAGIK